MLEFKQDDNRPRVVPDHPKDLNERRIAFTERCTPAVILSAVSEMDAGNPCVVAFEKAEAIFVGSRKMTNVQRGLEVRGETETLYKTSLFVLCCGDNHRHTCCCGLAGFFRGPEEEREQNQNCGRACGG